MAGTDIEKRSLLSITDNVQKLSDKQLFAPVVDEFMDIVWEEREQRLLSWAEEGRSQRWIAERVDRDQRTVGRWQERFGIKSTALRAGNQTGRKSTEASRLSDDYNDDYEEEEFAEEDEYDEEDVERQARSVKKKIDKLVGEMGPPRAPTPHKHSESYGEVVGILHGIANELERRLYPLLRGSYLEHEPEWAIQEVFDPAIEDIEKILTNLKAARKQYQGENNGN